MRLTLAVILATIFAATAFGAPSISGVSGTVTKYSTITLTGTGFGAHTDFNGTNHEFGSIMVPVFHTFNNQTLISNGATSIENNGSVSWSISQDVARYSGSYHATRFYNPDSPGFPRIAGLRREVPAGPEKNTNQVYVSFWVNTESLDDTPVGKHWRQFNTIPPGQSLSNFYAAMPNSSPEPGVFLPSSQYTLTSECSGCSPTPGSRFTAAGTNTFQWMRVDIWAKSDPSEIVMRVNKRDVLCISDVTTPGCPNAAAAGRKYANRPFFYDDVDVLNHGIGHMLNPGEGDREPRYNFDDWYHSPTLPHIEVCDKATWAEVTAGAHCEQQPPVSWSATEVQFVYNPGSFSPETPQYVYIVNDESTPFNPVANEFGMLLDPETPPPDIGGGGGGNFGNFIFAP